MACSLTSTATIRLYRLLARPYPEEEFKGLGETRSSAAVFGKRSFLTYVAARVRKAGEH